MDEVAPADCGPLLSSRHNSASNVWPKQILIFVVRNLGIDRLMPLRKGLFVLIALAALPASTSSAGRFEFRVTGVKRPDVLNVRERVDNQATISQKKILGQIPANATGLLGSGASLKVGPVRWYEIRYKDVRGWVNGRYLEPMSRELDDEFDSNLFCGGTEPFWALRIEDNTAELQRPDAPPTRYSVAVREPFQGRKDALAIRLVREDGSDISALVQHKEWCSDGMSDLEYAFEVRVVGFSEGNNPYIGCCSLLR